MRQILAVGLALALGALPLQAQETNDDMREGLSLLQEGTRLLLEGLLKELGPALLELQGRIIDLNITPLRRLLLYINVSTVDNRGESFARPEYYAARDFSPLLPLGPDCLLSDREAVPA